MKIYTSYYANLKKISQSYPEIVPISIAGRCPDWYLGAQYKKLAPKYWFFQQWKENHDNDFYIRNFRSEVLDNLDRTQVWLDLHEISDGKDIVLLCYEKPSDFCHRHLVAEWLGTSVAELEI